jgi:hypothetical protein
MRGEEMLTDNQNTNTTPPPIQIRVKQNDPAFRLRFGQPPNVELLERVASIALGFGLLTALGRRLFIVGGAGLLGLYLIYRGVAGYCPVYSGARQWQGAEQMAAGSGNATAGSSDGMEEDLERELRRERQRDKLDQRLWESFPASDPSA